MQTNLLRFIATFIPELKVVITSELGKDAFFVVGYDQVVISVKRRITTFKLTQSNILSCPELTNEELFTLAHEFGHYLSKRNGFHSKELLDLMYAQSGTVESNKASLEEEERAWQYAQWTLTSIGVTNFEEFNQLKQSSLSTYALTDHKEEEVSENEELIELFAQTFKNHFVKKLLVA